MQTRGIFAPFAPWAALFRLPNLATAAGDAVAGGALALGLAGSAPPGAVRAVFAAGAAEFLLYLAGLADNDIRDMEADRAAGRRRPLATGALSRKQVAAARAFCAVAALLVAGTGGAGPSKLPQFAATLALALSIALYNRVKEDLPVAGRLLMGSCRAFALASGFAAAVSAFPPGTVFGRAAFAPLGAAALGWTLYIAAVTRLGEREETAGAPLSFRRFVPAVFAVLPFGAHVSAALFRADLPGAAASLCALAAAATWISAVSPLGRPHAPRDRGRAVGRAIGGLLWMQTAFALCGAPGSPSPPCFIAFAAVCWAARLLFRAAAPAITGS